MNVNQIAQQRKKASGLNSWKSPRKRPRPVRVPAILNRLIMVSEDESQKSEGSLKKPFEGTMVSAKSRYQILDWLDTIATDKG